MISTVLIIWDDPAALRALEGPLEACQCKVLTADTVSRGVQLAGTLIPDIIVVGPVAENDDPPNICGRICGSLPSDRCPIILLAPNSGRWVTTDGENREEDQIAPEQLARGITTILGKDVISAGLITIDGLTLDRRRYRAELDGRELQFTQTEFRILARLAEQPGFVVPRRELLDGRRREQGVQDRTIDVHIKSIRQKLGDRGDLIQTVRGAGYRLQATSVVRQPNG